MKAAVRYYTKSGNTQKLAEQIAGTIGVEAKNVQEKLREDVDILFLGSSVYAAGVDDEVKRFIDKIDVKVGKVVNFSTAALVKSTGKQVRKLLKEKGIPMAEQEYYCKGSFGLLHKGRPDAKDLKNAADFAREIMNMK